MPLVDKNTKRIVNKTFEPKGIDFKEKKNRRKFESIVKFLGYKGLTKDIHNYIALKDGSYAEMVVLRGMSIGDLTYEQSENVVSEAGQYFRALSQEININFFSYSFKVNTHKQQKSWTENRDRLKLQIKYESDSNKKYQLTKRLEMVEGEISRQIFVEDTFWSREYLMLVFAPNKGRLENLMQTLSNMSRNENAPFKFKELTRLEKEKRLYTLNNPAGYLDN